MFLANNNYIISFFQLLSREVSEIKGKKKAGNIILCVISVLVLLCTLFLVLVSVIFYGDNSAPEIFGHRIYLVKTDAFSLVNNGTALIARTVPAEEIKAGNIVIFLDDEDKNTIGEIREATYSDGVYTYRTRLSNNAETTVGQSRLVAKGIYVSDTIGGLISFALSPAGVGVIAILPCSLIIVLEVLNFIKSRKLREQEDNDEDEPGEKAARPSAKADEREERDFSDLRSASQPERKFTPQETGLFQPPKSGTSFRQSAQVTQKIPISGRELDKIIKETKAEHQRSASAQQSAAQRERAVSQSVYGRQERTVQDEASARRERNLQADAPVQREQPVRASASAAAADRYRQIQEQTELPSEAKSAVKSDTVPIAVSKSKSSAQHEPKISPAYRSADEDKMSPLDRLLQGEQEDDEHYDIDDILKSLEKY